jgi:hypothetical protein
MHLVAAGITNLPFAREMHLYVNINVQRQARGVVAPHNHVGH